MTRGPVNSDLIGGVIGLLLAGTFWYAREGNWSFWSAAFPNVIIVLIAVLSLLLLVKGAFAPAMLRLFHEGRRSKMLVTAILLIVWSFAFSRLGTIASSAIGFVVLAVYLASGTTRPSPRAWATGAVVIAAEIALFYLLFTRVLHVPLPRGVLF